MQVRSDSGTRESVNIWLTLVNTRQIGSRRDISVVTFPFPLMTDLDVIAFEGRFERR
jgi:hypothetical protein